MSLHEQLRALFREHHETCNHCCFYDLDGNLCEDLVGKVAAIVAPEPASHCDAIDAEHNRKEIANLERNLKELGE